ncbi:MAG: diaminopimelate decarboxylase [Pseudomonadota bacterium]
MHHFEERGGVMHAEDVALTDIADAVGTPFYCYSEATIRRHMQVFRGAFGDADMLTAYSVKANSNLSVLTVLAQEGAGADVVSEGELRRARAVGIPGEKIVFSGVGKTRDEMAYALGEGIHQFNVESEPELHQLNEVALARGAVAPIAFRVNPDVSAGAHEKISTGKAEDKFGIPWSRAHALFAQAHRLPGIAVKAVDVHIGSQIADLAPFETAFKKVADLVLSLRAEGIPIERVDLGGGLGIPYADGDAIPPHPDEYATMIRRIADPLGVQLIFEPGRMIVGNAGILVSQVIFNKPGTDRRFLIIDAAMNDLLRPALYDAYHDLRAVVARDAGDPVAYDVVGPICETGDRFARARSLPALAAGDLVAFMSAGAYGAVQSSEYNSRPLVPEVMVKGDAFSIIRPRPDYQTILGRDQIAPWLAP